MGRKLLTIFQPELKNIKNKELAELTKKIIMQCSDENAIRSASSTGKHHPECDNGNQGLVRHTRNVIAATETFMKMNPMYDGLDSDYPYIAALLHDFCKYTEKDQKYVHFDHPAKMAEIIRAHKPTSQEGWFIDYKELATGLERIARIVESHMSRWHTDKNGKQMMPFPSNMESWMVAMADMITSRDSYVAYFDENDMLVEYHQNVFRADDAKAFDKPF